MTTHKEAATETDPRLTFRSWPPFEPADSFSGYVAVTERLGRKRSVAFTYALRVVDLPSDLPFRAFQFFKEGDATPRELQVYPSGHQCRHAAGG